MSMRNLRLSRIIVLLLLIIVSTPGIRAQEVEPLIKAQWGQDYPYNLMCAPLKNDTTGTKHVLAGCAPIAMSQTMRHFRSPASSPLLGNHYEYDWMFAQHTDSITDDERLAVAQLVIDCGRAAGTKYTQTSASTKLNSVVTALKQYFGYNKNMHILDRKFFTGLEGRKAWMNTIKRELAAGRPVIMRAERSKTYAHVFIVDGCTDSTLHCNFGWYGKSNAYYDPDTLHGFRTNQRMIIGVSPKTIESNVRKIHLVKPGTLRSKLIENDWRSVYSLQVSGTLGSDDFSVLRQLCGGGTNGERNGNVCILDLTRTTALFIPAKAFYACENLTYVTLPYSVKQIGRQAFANCQKLNGVHIYNNVDEIGQSAFSGCFNLFDVALPSSLITIHSNAFNSCTSLLSVKLPRSVKTIDSGAFANCSKLAFLSMSKSTRLLGSGIIKGCRTRKIQRY